MNFLKKFLTVCFCLLLFSGTADAALVNLYKFDNNANDSVGGNNGTVTGATAAVGYFSLASGNSSYLFDSDDERIELTRTPFDYLTTSDFSYESWFRTSTDHGNDSIIFNNQDANVNGHSMMYLENTERLVCAVYSSGGGYMFKRSPNTYNDGLWHHIVCSYNGTSKDMKMYIDGIDVTVTYISAAINPGNFFKTTGKAAIGARWNNATLAWSGEVYSTIGRFSNYNHILTHRDAQLLFRIGKFLSFYGN